MAQAFDKSRLCPVPLDISAITAQCHVWRSPRNHRCGGLDYQWGDDLGFPVDDPLPFSVVVQPDQRKAYADAVSEVSLRTDLDAELAAMAEIIRTMKARL